jgi:uncharacterized protein
MELFERSLFKDIIKYLDKPDIVVVHGARQVGKTSLLKYIQAWCEGRGLPTLYFDLEDTRHAAVLDRGPEEFVHYIEERGLAGRPGQTIHLFLDEIHNLSDPSKTLKLFRDHYADRFKVFVSGSSTFAIKSKFRNSLAGRTIEFDLYPLSFREFLTFKGSRTDISRPVTTAPVIHELKSLFSEYARFGGYPRIVLEKTRETKEDLLQQIIDTYVRRDIRDFGNVRDVGRFNALLEILASQAGSQLNVNELASTIRLARPTVEQYLFILENTYMINLLRPFSRNLRSELSKMPKIYFCDTGMSALLWQKQLPLAINGAMFENAVFSELLKQRGARDLYYWRTQDKKEIDFVLKRGQKLSVLEAKLNGASFKSTSLEYFRNNYGPAPCRCVTLELPSNKTRPEMEYCYPWEIIKERGTFDI